MNPMRQCLLRFRHTSVQIDSVLLFQNCAVLDERRALGELSGQSIIADLCLYGIWGLGT